MSKIVRSFALVAAMAGLVSMAGMTSAPAQDKKKDAKDSKATKEEVGTIEVYMAKDGWRFKVMNTEGKSVAIGTVGFDTKEEAIKTIEFIKTTLNKAKVEVTDKGKDKGDKDKGDKKK